MRPIKFRAWDADRNKMFSDPKWVEFVFDKEGRLSARNFDRSGKVQELTIMQFTGLLDSQGVEIYEGDIVVKNEYIWFCDGEPNYRGTVEWIYSQWQVVSHCVNPEKRGISDGINRGLNDDGVEDGDKSEWIVIGNIHQHPELLK